MSKRRKTDYRIMIEMIIFSGLVNIFCVFLIIFSPARSVRMKIIVAQQKSRNKFDECRNHINDYAQIEPSHYENQFVHISVDNESKKNVS